MPYYLILYNITKMLSCQHIIGFFIKFSDNIYIIHKKRAIIIVKIINKKPKIQEKSRIRRVFHEQKTNKISGEITEDNAFERK